MILIVRIFKIVSLWLVRQDRLTGHSEEDPSFLVTQKGLLPERYGADATSGGRKVTDGLGSAPEFLRRPTKRHYNIKYYT